MTEVLLEQFIITSSPYCAQEVDNAEIIFNDAMQCDTSAARIV